MDKGLIGKKLGMTQIFVEDGRRIPVTVVEAGPCVVVQKKTAEKDGYNAIQVGFASKDAARASRPLLGHCKAAGKGAFSHLRELRLDDVESINVGDLISADVFAAGDTVDVTGTSIGKGFQGVVKRHHYAGGPASHGSMFYRAPGSIGASSFPSRVWKNKGLPGHMGSERTTVKNLTVVDIKAEQNLLLILGAVPGSKGTYLEIRKEN